MSGSSVGKNAAWLMAATTLNKLIAFATFMLVARFAGVSVTGTYFFGVAVTSVFVILTDLGMTPVVIRAVSASREDGPRLLGAAIRAKLFFIPVAVAASLGYGLWRGAAPDTFWTIAVACGVMSADAVHLVLYGALRGRQNLRFEALGMLIGQILTAGIAITVALLYPTAVGLAAALLAGSAWNVAWSAVQLRRNRVPIERPRAADLRRLVKEALPFGIAGIAVKVYSYVDSLLIEKFHGLDAVGLYAVAYKMTYALQFIPLTFTAALYPALAKQWADRDQAKLRETFLGSMRFLAAVGFPASAGLSALAPRIILFVYGEKYAGAIPAFEILPWVLLPIFIDFPIGALLNATHRAHLKTTAMVVTMVMNITLNAFLVPEFGPLGAAWAGVVSFWTLMFIGCGFALKDAGGWAVYARLLLRAMAAAVVSWIAWRIIGEGMPFILAAIFGSTVAVASAFVVRLVSYEDILKLLRRVTPPPSPSSSDKRRGEEDIHADA